MLARMHGNAVTAHVVPSVNKKVLLQVAWVRYWHRADIGLINGCVPLITLRPVPMSALGQKQTLRRLIAMSALPPKADLDRRHSNVCFVPIADMPTDTPRPHA
jgi:hypothetical protein